MSSFKGTPGPWAGKDIGICRQDDAGLQLGFIVTTDEKRRDECAANAQLIAAAPDLLEALQDLRKAWLNGSAYDIIAAEIKADFALKKAIGDKND